MERDSDGYMELLAEVSPNGNITAIVEQDDRVAYLYLHGHPDTDFGIRPCWIRNLKKAPKALNTRGIRKGIAPMLPAKHCRHPQGAAPLEADRLSVIWFEEGDAVALLEDKEILAVIPGWSDDDGFHGFARDCIGDSALCWELGSPDDNVLHERTQQAADFWHSWDSSPTPWPKIQKSMMAAYEAVAPHSNYYAIDNDEWPPSAMLRVPVDDAVFLATLGVCTRPQPTVEQYSEKPELLRRIELAIGLHSGLGKEAESRIADWVSAQARLPWSAYSWLGQGHTIRCDVMPPNERGPQFAAVLLHTAPPGAPVTRLPGFREDPVNLLWLIPITETEWTFAKERTSKVLSELLWSAGVDWMVRGRPEVSLP